MKKDFLKVAILGLSLNFMNIGCKDAPSPSAVASQQMIQKLLNDGKDHQYLALLEMHTHDNIAFLARPEILQALSENGYQKIVLEHLHHMQTAVDLYANQKISKDIFIAVIELEAIGEHLGFTEEQIQSYYNTMADLVVNAKNFNIQIVCADGKNYKTGIEDPFMEKMSKDFVENWIQHLQNNDDYFKIKTPYEKYEYYANFTINNMTDYLSSLGEEERGKFKEATLKSMDNIEFDLNENPEDFILNRLKNDGNIASRIKRSVRNEKAVILYGFFHFSRQKNDIDFNLGTEKVKQCIFAKNEADYEELLNIYQKGKDEFKDIYKFETLPKSSLRFDEYKYISGRDTFDFKPF